MNLDAENRVVLNIGGIRHETYKVSKAFSHETLVTKAFSAFNSEFCLVLFLPWIWLKNPWIFLVAVLLSLSIDCHFSILL